jgi:hypothetical protein
MKLELTARSRTARLAVCVSSILAAGCGSTPSALHLGDDTAPGADAEATDGGSFFTEEPDGGPLEAHLQINGAHAVCGTCAVLIAQTQGGMGPYSYAWSDPSLTGPGPHEVCPDAPTRYSVTVTDSSGSSAGEITRPPAKVSVSGSVDCTPPPPDAGTSAGLVGCRVTTSSANTDAGMAIECTANETTSGIAAILDGGVVDSLAGKLPGTLLAGHTYSFAYDRVLPLSIGNAVTVDVYGSNDPDVCAQGERLFEMHLDGSLTSWNLNYCFTPTKDYTYAVTDISVQGVLLYTNAFVAGTVCDTCSM